MGDGPVCNTTNAVGSVAGTTGVSTTRRVISPFWTLYDSTPKGHNTDPSVRSMCADDQVLPRRFNRSGDSYKLPGSILGLPVGASQAPSASSASEDAGRSAGGGFRWRSQLPPARSRTDGRATCSLATAAPGRCDEPTGLTRRTAPAARRAFPPASGTVARIGVDFRHHPEPDCFPPTSGSSVRWQTHRLGGRPATDHRDGSHPRRQLRAPTVAARAPPRRRRGLP